MNEFETPPRTISWEEFSRRDFSGQIIRLMDTSDESGWEIKGPIKKISVEADKIVIELESAMQKFNLEDEPEIVTELRFELPKNNGPKEYSGGYIAFEDCGEFDTVDILPR